MRILTNAGANLSAEQLAHYGIELTPTRMVVDGVEHDCRTDIALEQVDAWVASADEHPFLLGTSAAEIARRCLEVADDDGELLVATSSRKIIPSYDAARSAARTLESHPLGKRLKLRVVDSSSTDLGLGLPVLAAAEAARAGLDLDAVADVFDSLAQRGRYAVLPRTIDNLVRGGRASFLRGWMAKMFGLRPLLSFVDGEPQVVAKCGAKDDYPRVLAQWCASHVPAGRVWVGVAHGNAPEDAESLTAELRRSFEVVYAVVRPISPSVYLHAGPRALQVLVFPLDGLPWIPPTPPS